MKRFVVPVFWVLLMVCSMPYAMAQSQNISGTVVDPSGAVVPGAQVKLTDTAKGSLAREVITDDTGRFQAINLQPGKYLVVIELAGFKKAEVPVTLDVNSKLDIGQIRLEVGQVNEVISVTEVAPVVQTNTMEKAFLVEPSQIQNLPMNGRNWVALMKTVPGVISSTGNDFDTNFNDVSGFHAAGGRGSQNNFYLDGSPNLDVGDNQSQYTQPSIESIAEFKVQQSSFNAEYGRNSGMVVAVQTKSGGSGFHGTAYEYLRNDALDAIPFGKTTADTLRYNLFGGNISGWVPVPKISTRDDKKVFFFYNREMTRRNIVPAGQNFVDIPGPATLLRGDFSAFNKTGNQMDHAPFPVGTVFQPGSLKFDGSGNIIDGVPYAGNLVPPSTWNSRSSSLMKLFTGIPGYESLPAAPAPGLVRWTFSSPQKLNKDQDLLRLDYNLSSRTSTYFRWVNDDQIEFQPGAIWGWNSYGPQLPFAQMERPKPGSSWSWNIVNSFSSTLASETILSYNHQSQRLAPSDTNGDRDAMGVNFTQLYPGTNVANYLPDFQAGANNGLPGMTIAWGDPGWHNDGKDYAFTQNLTWIRKAHAFKFGFYYNRDNKKQTATWGQQGEIGFFGGPNNPGDTGSNLANLLLGHLSYYRQSNASIYPYFRFQSWEGFAQDSWRVSRRLTLEYGVRFQRTTPTYTYTRDASPGAEGTFPLYMVDVSKWSAATAPRVDPATGTIIGDILQEYLENGLVCDPCPGTERGFAETKSFLSPRLGFAFDVFGDGKMAIRGGFGQFVERLRQNNFNFGAGSQFPNGGGFEVQNINVNQITSGPPPRTTFPSLTYYPQSYTGGGIFPVGNTMPKVYSWNIGVQRDIGHDLALDVSYVGNRGNHLMVQRNVNGTGAGAFLTPAYEAANFRQDLLRPYLGYASLRSIETSGSSSYHAMLLRFGRRFSNRYSFNVNYTLSSAYNLVDNDSDGTDSNSNAFIDPRNPGLNWAPAGYDATHSLNIDYVVDLPHVNGNRAAMALLNGWQISGITHYQTGFPISIISNGSLLGADAGIQYANLVGDPYAGQTKYRWLNPNAFERPPDGQYGNMERNSLRGQGYGNFDATLARNIRLTEDVSFKIQMDVFNVFNHSQVLSINQSWAADNQGGGPNQSTLGNFGTITGYRPARILQFGFKLMF
jgi:hypothetical protein